MGFISSLSKTKILKAIPKNKYSLKLLIQYKKYNLYLILTLNYVR